MDAYHRSIVNLVKAALDEDIGRGDLTSIACLEPDSLKAEIVAKSDGVLSGVEPAMATFHIVDSANIVTFLKNDGDEFQRGDRIAELEGFNRTVLASERVALNFLGHLSGVASLTRQFVKKLRGTNCRILDTRKTTPGFRLLEKKAVIHGGGTNHRIGLYDMVLIKDNHIASAGSIAKAVALTREFLTTPDFRTQFGSDMEKPEIEIEVSDERQLREAIEAGVDRLLLDNQSVDSLTKLVATARELSDKVRLEASGNVTLDNVAQIGATGVDFVSSGAVTHSAPNSDFSMKVKG
jgi:nicotinate-nucleotide pyrophosphorylase (carboxylating)